MTEGSISIIMPAKNESATIEALIERIRALYPDAEIIVVNDASTDDTAEAAARAGARVISNYYSLGNGGAIKVGTRAAKGEILVFMDADGQHDPAFLPKLLERLDCGFDMVVGARATVSQASIWRGMANGLYNRLASYMTGQRILDLTSGYRAVRARRFREFLYLLPNGFSYPTTITMAFFRAGYMVDYVCVAVKRRVGKSHISPLKDGLRFLLIIFKIGTLYSPMKLFAPFAFFHGLLGIGYYAYTYITDTRLSLATVFLLTAAVTIFLIGLVSEQITTLLYKDSSIQEISD